MLGAVNEEEIYRLTPAGEAELGGSATTLAPVQLELLVRIDDVLKLGKVREGMAKVSDEEFARALFGLRGAGLIERVDLDTFALRLEDDLAKLQMSGGEEADAGLRSLKRSGYLVSIARRRPATPPAATGRPLTATVVEDDPQLARFIASYLGFQGFVVRSAGNRKEVVDQFRTPPVPDLVVLDVVLPDADGFDILGSLRRHPAFRKVPVIMLTGKATREAVLKGMAGGADGYITKPFEPAALMAAVRTVMGLPEKR
jgi:CheY-like chemotaxis protein